MRWQGTIDFSRPIQLNGQPHGVERVSSLSTWQVSDEGRVVYTEDTGKLWVGDSSQWQELTPGGVGAHDHNDLYYTEVEVDGMFEGKNGEKQQVAWTNVLNKPSTFAPDTHTHTSFSTIDGFSIIDDSAAEFVINASGSITSKSAAGQNLLITNSTGANALTIDDSTVVLQSDGGGSNEASFSFIPGSITFLNSIDPVQINSSDAINLISGNNLFLNAQASNVVISATGSGSVSITGQDSVGITSAGNIAFSDVNVAGPISFSDESNTSLNGSATSIIGGINEAYSNVPTHGHDSASITYDNTTSGLTADNVQTAVDEINSGMSLRPKSFIYVDLNRTDSYTEVGTQSYPFKTVSSATAVATNGVNIFLSEGTYTENITLPEGVGLIGSGTSKTYLEGTLTTTNKAMSRMSDFSLYNTWTITSRAQLNNIYCNSQVFINGATDAIGVEGRNVTIGASTGVAMVIGDNVESLKFSSGGIASKDGSSAITSESGVIVFDKYIIEVRDVASSNPAISLSGTTTLQLHQSLIQTTGGNAIVSSASGMVPNFISDTQYAGGEMIFGSSPTIVEGVHDLTGTYSTPSGSAIIQRSSSQLSYDNSASGMVATQVKEAIDEVYSAATAPVIPSTSGIPTDSPEIGTTRFDSATDTLYVYNGSTWVSTVLT